jgi:hypothetical protein
LTEIFQFNILIAVYPRLCGIIDEHGVSKEMAFVLEHKKHNFKEI